MATKPQRPKRWDGVLPLLNAGIEAMNLAEKISSVTPAKAAFGTVGALLTMIKESMVNELDYVELALSCADICRALERGIDGMKLDDLSQSVWDAINQLMTTVAEIRNQVFKQERRSAASRFWHAKNDKETIAGWKLELNRILTVFNTELIMNTHAIVTGIHQNVLKIRDGQHPVTQNSTPGDLPPPPPGIFLGRDELIETVVSLAERLRPIAMIGAGGIGKTSIALTVLHDDRIRRRFGDQRRFIRCDKFPASLTHFLRQLSKTVGAGVENPEDLTPLRPFLSSKDMFIVLDNAESILDPYVMNAQEIYGVVEELGQMSNICICITSRISTSPPDFESLDIPTLSKEAACETFYRIYKRGQRSDSIDSILEQLDFHALSITLLATVAHHNRWDTTRLVKEWDERHTGILQTDHNKSLASAIELSLSSLIFQELGPNARDLLGVIAFFPQGVYESNIDWLFPTISGRKNMLDKFCVLSLAYRNDGFITMLAPIRDYLSPKDPISSPLLISTKNRYFSRLSVQLKTGEPGFEEARWIVSEDVNVEHLLNVFIAADVTSRSVWRACHDFIGHLYWRKPRLVALGPKIEALADDHPSKVRCLVRLSKLLQAVGNHAERERLLTHALKLSQEQGDDHGSTKILRHLSRVWSGMGRHKEGVQQAKRALEISERLGGAKIQARCLISFAKSLYNDKQLGAAEETVYRATNLFTEEGEPSMTVKYHRLLGRIYHSKGDTENAIHHFEVALGIASSRNSLNQQFWIRYGLAELFGSQGRFEDAHAHIERAKSHAADDHDIYLLARAMKVRARFWHRQRSFEEARSEALRAVDVFEKLGAAKHVKRARRLLQRIDDDATRTNGLFDESDEDDKTTESE